MDEEYGKIVARAVLAMLCFILCFTQQISKYYLNERKSSNNRYSRALKIKESHLDIRPDGNGLKWRISRDKKFRWYIAATARGACAIVGKNEWSGIQNPILVLAGDITALNPGPIHLRVGFVKTQYAKTIKY